MKEKIREKLISASYKKGASVVSEIIALVLAIVLVLTCDFYFIAWFPIILSQIIVAINKTGREVVEKNKLFLIVLSYDGFWFFAMISLIYAIGYEVIRYNSSTYVMFLLFLKIPQSNKPVFSNVECAESSCSITIKSACSLAFPRITSVNRTSMERSGIATILASR